MKSGAGEGLSFSFFLILLVFLFIKKEHLVNINVIFQETISLDFFLT